MINDTKEKPHAEFSRLKRAGMVVQRVLLVDGEFSLSVDDMQKWVNPIEGMIHLDSLSCILSKYGWHLRYSDGRGYYSPAGVNLFEMDTVEEAEWLANHMRNVQTIISSCDQWLEWLESEENMPTD